MRDQSIGYAQEHARLYKVHTQAHQELAMSQPKVIAVLITKNISTYLVFRFSCIFHIVIL